MGARNPPERRRRWSLPLLRVFDVTIRVHVTFVALVLLVALSAQGAGESALEEVGWLVALFTCVLVHELAHALVARSKGIAVHEIDLLPVGGVSRLERIPDDWRDERAIAAAGPLASAGIAMLAAALAAVRGQPLLPPSMWDGPLLARLAWVNVMLAGFNLLPAFPLDGGRVLRALLERTRSRVAATRHAVQVSQMLASVMIGLGLLTNVWLIVIGVFVLVAGRDEEAAVLIHAVLAPVRAHSLAVSCPIVLPGAMRVGEAARVAGQVAQPCYPVVGVDGEILGAVNVGVLLGSPRTARLDELATGTIADAEDSLERVAEHMESEPIVVTRGQQVVGAITVEILNDYLRERLTETA